MYLYNNNIIVYTYIINNNIKKLGGEGKLSELYSVSINILYRISIDFIIDEDKIILINIGKHPEVYWII